MDSLLDLNIYYLQPRLDFIDSMSLKPEEAQERYKQAIDCYSRKAQEILIKQQLWETKKSS